MEGRPNSPSTTHAVRYAWRQLAQRAGIQNGDPEGTGFEELNVTVHYGEPTTVELVKPGVVVVPCRLDAWQGLLDQPSNSLDWLPDSHVLPPGGILPVGASVPVLFWGDGYEGGHKPFAERLEDGTVVFYADIIAATLFMLTRWEEMVVPTRDEHDRFPASGSVAYRQGFLDRPIIDEYALILRQWMKTLLPGWQPEKRQFSIRLSHDIDSVKLFSSFGSGVRAVAGDLLKRRNLRLAWRSGTEAIAQTVYPQHTRQFRGIHRLADVSQMHGVRSAFFFMADDPGPFSSDYNVSSRLLRRCFDGLRNRGCEIGLHAGYLSYNDPCRLSLERARLEAAVGEGVLGGRQHYLRFLVPDTWRHWEQVGLEYDSTMAFADHEGFRCGTCHPYRPFDTQQGRELSVLEIPLVVMDATLRRYRLLSPEEGQRCIVELARRCRDVEGTFALLWHNSSLDGDWSQWGDAYQRSLSVVTSLAK